MCRVLFLATTILILTGARPCQAQRPQVRDPLVIKWIDEIDVPALETGALKSVEVKLGQVVSAGDVVANIDDRLSRARLELAINELDSGRQKAETYVDDQVAEKQLAQSETLLQREQINASISEKKAENEVRVSAAAKAEAVAENEWKRASNARQRYLNSVSESELESLRLKFERAELERRQAEFEQRLERLTNQADLEAVRGAELDVERAKLESISAKAAKQQLLLEIQTHELKTQLSRINLDRHQVIAPTGGMVVELYKRAGEWVRPGDAVLRIVRLNELHAEGFVDGELLPEVGRQVELVARDASDNPQPQAVEGTVAFVSPERDPINGQVRFLVRLPGGVFRPGDQVEIRW
jgi:multidrug resistance efflux pump